MNTDRGVISSPSVESEWTAARRETVDRLNGIRDQLALYDDCSARKAGIFAKLAETLPPEETAEYSSSSSRGNAVEVDAAKKRLLEATAARRVVELKLVEGRRKVSQQRAELAAKKAKVLRAMEGIETARVRLAEATDVMYNTTFNRLSIIQQNLTFRRWELAQGVAHIFSLSTIDALRSPPASPAREGGASTSSYHRGASDLNGGGGYQSPGSDMRRQRNISICGLELDSSVIKKNKEAMLDQENGNHAEKLATALGYVAHILQLLSAYFDIPLRYPVKPVNSRSYICDVVPSKGLGGGAGGGGSSKQGGGKGGAPSVAETIKFPLYIDHVGVERERTRFAYAVFLLNKDIEQILNAHGLDAFGVAPHFTLSNLHKLLSYSN
ncbi:hypothetical protein HOP50_05g35970 [Chloropicon primus]|uniref:Uncharacterized protein n=2 Tax=Chloropicon primus TaxID=1764295 RepID=A0A5B8MP20_9CHLO|nr:hypothetical protein A3770_05p35900 [Chloropicon primus]UPR00283.1 hypothetical protein HOP50_05g35970 [Chloropicon primus]|eukprot:QDZ21072.1 hypothetical protein A3770_05p35900 [Chloropicon primus]